MSPTVRLSARLACALALTACSGPAPTSGTPTFSGTVYLTATSASGALRVDMRTWPQPPAMGTNALELTVTDAADGAPRDDLTVAVSPWMPAMNHGSSAIPTVTPQGHGKYLVTEVYLFMPGLWQLRTSFSGGVTDHVTPAVEIQ
jgi:hypothetical protein